jgi:hypothetical protein
MARKRQMKKTARKQRGGDWLSPSTWKLNPFSSTPTTEPPLDPTPLPGSTTAETVVAPVTDAVKTAGKRLKKHFGGDPTSPTDAKKVLGTAPEGPNPALLGGRRRRRTVKKSRKSRK